jgi:hypothetical protein
MKYFLYFLIILLLPAFSLAQEKVIEKSRKKKPAWVNAVMDDYIIVTGRGKTIDEAKSKVTGLIRNEIMNAVAVYVSSETEMTTENINKNNVINTIEKYKNTSTVQTGDIPSLKGISLNKAEDFYWEKLKDKKNKGVTVAYHVLYPFSKRELRKLVNEFENKDREMTEKLNSIVEHIDEISSIDEIYMDIKELEQLLNYFIDKQRTERTKMGIVRLKEMLKSIEIVPLENEPGTIVYTFKIGDKFYSSSKKPTYKNSECINIISKTSEGYKQIIKYSYEDCYEYDQNQITVKYKFGNNRLEKTFYINTTKDKIKVYIKGAIIFTKQDETDDKITKSKCEISLFSKYDASFKVQKVELKWKGMPKVVIDGINASFEGKGAHTLVFEINQPLDKTKTSSENAPYINGTIFIESLKTNEVSIYQFYNQNTDTDW